MSVKFVLGLLLALAAVPASGQMRSAVDMLDAATEMANDRATDGASDMEELAAAQLQVSLHPEESTHTSHTAS